MGFILVIHVVVCILLVITILMQSGRGGGLTETFQSAESMFGTQTNVILVQTTTVLAAIFLSTSLFLAFNSSKGNKSLMMNTKLLATVPKPAPAKPAGNDVQVKIGTPTPVATTPTTAPREAQEVPVNPVTNATK